MLNSRMKAFIKNLIHQNPLILNTQTTGLGKRDEVLSISITDYKGQPVFYSLVKPIIHDSWLSAEAINGISPATVANAPTFADIAQEVAGLLNGRYVTAWNVNFDITMLKQSAVVHKLKGFEAWLGHPYLDCVMENYAQLNRRRAEKLAVVCQRYGVNTDAAHTAVGDCQMIAGLFDVWLKEATNG